MPPLAPARPAPTPAEALAAVESELAAVPSHAVRPPSLDLLYAARTAMEAARRLEMLHQSLAGLPDFDMQPVLRLRLYAAAALCAAQLRAPQWRSPTSPGTQPPRLVLGSTREGRLPRSMGAPVDPADRCARAYTLLLRAYHHCRRGVTFLRWRHGDVDRFLPPLLPPVAHRRARWTGIPALHPIADLPPSMVDTITAL